MTTSRVLVLGAGGMLGHKMFQASLAAFPDTWCTLHGKLADYPVSNVDAFRSPQVIDEWDAMHFEAVEAVLSRLRPQFVINCVGVIKQRAAAEDPIQSITLNSLLPHRVAAILSAWEGRLIHISTDCVFDGIRGGYRELDFTNARDLYGRTKALGETLSTNALTLRTSIIGRELRSHNSLLDWFLSQNHGSVHGYTKVLWSGVTANHLADLITTLIGRWPTLSGLYQVSSGPISKYDLLRLIRGAYGLDIEILPDDSFVLDRTLAGEKLEAAIGYHCPSHTDLVHEMADDSTQYPSFYSTNDIANS